VTRFNALLVVVLIACALSLVSARYQARHLLGELDTVQNNTHKLEIDWNQLQLDQASLSKHALIEVAARRELGMQAVTPARTQYLSLSVQGVSLHDAPGAAGDAK
jgi:cell division protein FtsL